MTTLIKFNKKQTVDQGGNCAWIKDFVNFKNRTGERTGKRSGSRTSGPTGVGPVVESVIS
jgi:hypothetical protein